MRSLLAVSMLATFACATPRIAREIPFGECSILATTGSARRIWAFETGSLVMPEGYATPSSPAIDIPIMAYAIELADGAIVLFDTGLSHRFADDARDYYGYTSYQAATALGLFPKMRVGQDLPSQMIAAGLDPARVSTIVVSHGHVDHTGELPSFPKARVIFSPKDRARMKDTLAGYQPRDLEGAGHFDDGLRVLAGRCHGFAHARALVPDGSLVVVDAPGHTPGSQALFVALPHSLVLLVGDAAYVNQNFIGPTPKGSHPAHRPDEDPDAAWETLLRIHAAHRAGVRVLTAHDPALRAIAKPIE